MNDSSNPSANVDNVTSTTESVVVIKDGPSGTPPTYTQSTIVSSFDQLPPDLRNMMLKGIAQNVCVRIKRQSDNLKKAMREGRD